MDRIECLANAERLADLLIKRQALLEARNRASGPRSTAVYQEAFTAVCDAIAGFIELDPGRDVYEIVTHTQRAHGGSLYRVSKNGEQWLDGYLTYAEALSRKTAAEQGEPIPRVGL